MNTDLTPRITIMPNAERLARNCAAFFCRTAVESVARNGRFHVALSGGSTPRPMHRLLATPPYLTDIPWAHTHIYWADERLVTEDDPASNFGAAKKDLLDRLPIQKEHIHPMVSPRPPSEAAADYERLLAKSFGTDPPKLPIFDCIFLGIGQDGHTASIFPGDRTAVDTTRWVVAVNGGSPNVDRLTLTLAVLRQARCIVFLVTGSDKAETVQTILEQDRETLPPQWLASNDNQVFWFLDQDAARLLTGDTFRNEA